MAFASINQTSVGGGSSNALSIQSDGIFMPRLSTAQRTALALTTSDTGLTVYDFTLNNLFIWNGTAWESIPGSGDAGANGSVQYNDNGIVSGATNFVWDKVNGRVGIGTATPAYPLHVAGTGYFSSILTLGGASRISAEGSNALNLNTNSVDRLTIDSSGNVGVGVTPSAWASYKGLQSGTASLAGYAGGSDTLIGANVYFDGGAFRYIAANIASEYRQLNGVHRWSTAVTGLANALISGTGNFTPAMTLDASGNLLVGITSGTSHIIKKTLTPDAGNVVLDIYGNNTSATFYSVGSYAANAANAAAKFGRDGTTFRSINAGGTVNASGADYAEYMVKCGDFVIAKGDVAGIDSNGKLTNVFADAVSFVVKSTDPSYVGNDKWGVDLEGAAIEAARQLVDRIAFAGQVPVNVTGAKAGDYIVPVVNGTGIKGISVSKPTFEQYQIAVGKVITIDTDGRARIIVKVA